MIADRAALARIAEVQNPKAPALLGDKVEARAIRLVPLHFCVGVAHCVAHGLGAKCYTVHVVSVRGSARQRR